MSVQHVLENGEPDHGRGHQMPILQLLQALWNGHVYESRRVITRERIVQTTRSLDINLSQGRNSGVPSWDFFLGPRLDSHDSAPAQEAAVAAMPTVKIEESLSCPVCQEDFEIGAEAKEMPCKHKFHADCILPWLTLHSSCPVCRFQMLTEESTSSSAGGNGTGGGDERGPWLPVTWPFTGLSLLGSHRSADSSSSQPSSSSNGSNS
ncbi:hypothetical protein C4D60_Mb10t23870 [Musa balbisiana]|uniref:RING-type E3 ubiquitin transferase n=1 Tax=Musa balbisiana TaxID=52838 RepID=A0A4S8IZE5_MUSBA|nr:hypothetical protein C4D60_Mb10t23870 [Musa balbisiana]